MKPQNADFILPLGWIGFCISLLLLAIWSVTNHNDVKNQHTEMTNRGCTKHYRVGQGKSEPYQYAVWKCPNDTNEYLVK